jgi:hypothetical protein
MSSSNVVDAFSEEERNVQNEPESRRPSLDISDDDIERYRKAYDLAYEFGERKLREEGSQQRQNIEKGASEQRKTERTQEARDNAQARRAYKF